ncbi:mannose-1-phosphate guanylyltransferase / mannose-6-phosphate isomerase [Aliiroseovarius halocynthiae]|uniref:mannose-1-phosphate guanylyltransferase n=1 Tax=Aliiroseovarius halocynthiae TaxID=985055 RepID=A0A545SWP0_9RHOB|nr:mannose-1-phosphate guanylyltransferase/mannose-6-phosphate isomerase [Aliiroseovarius halocynthiae]TQV69392.1 mannose-1-phosphate guanylyltransferase/mannose-6-phosphate isomerase [Aliiroseovarius halocynthiae]SMR72781.1 mannose-1-phosphate guanylyltransferase / mannose-6-phosphate isomerase [Aliiroseovarius halocynthiae]
MITPVLLCGGSGTRLWPLSRKSYPKQFSSLLGDESLFQDSARRLSGEGYAKPLVVTTNDFRFIVTEQLAGAGIEADAVLIEPAGRDTAPAILAAALHLAQSDPDGLMLVAPSDHVIPDADAFSACVHAAIPAAQEGQLVTFGISPDRPETGYGYLELDAAPTSDLSALPLKAFVEKPDAETAAQMLAEGRYLWNAGIFLFSVPTILEAFKAHAPDLITAVDASINAATTDLGFIRLDPEAWASADAISIDFAVMEKADNLSVVPFAGRWSDLGDWAAVWRETQSEGVSLSGPATSIDCENTLLRSEVESQQIVGIGLEDIVAVAMPDAVLISHKGRTQEVKQAVIALKEKQAPQAEAFPKDHRPWGWFESLVIGDRFQVKRIVVRPGAALSLQSHHHRSEHWIVVEGTARVTVDDDVKLVSENESVYIPLGAMHRLENPGKLPMVLIEVQTGSYLGEDDIIRFEDAYARD